MVTFSFQGEFTVELTGYGSLADELKNYYDKLSIPGTRSDPHLEVGIHDFDCNPSHVLGGPDLYFGREGDWLLRVDQAKRIKVRRDWSEIRATPNVPRAWVYTLIEYQARRALAKEGLSIIHASGMRTDETTIVFPAWRHTGKTNTLLTFLRERNADYLSDDRLWLGRDGSVHGIPLPVNVFPYNFDAFGDIQPPTRFYHQRYRLSEFLRANTSDSGSFLSKAFYFVNEDYIVPPAKKVRIEDLFSGVDFLDEADLDALVCLQTVPDRKGAAAIELKKIASERAGTYLQSINRREWNRRIQLYGTAFDVLFDDRSGTEDLEELQDQEREIWRDVLDQVDTYVLTLPREERWKQKNLSEKILDEVQPILD